MPGFCPECGTAREGDAATCTNCDHPFVAPANAVQDVEAGTGRKRVPLKWIGLGVGALVVASVGGWMLAPHGWLPGFGTSAAAPVDLSLLPVSFGGKCGYVDASGKMVINPQFDNALPFNSSLDAAAVLVGGKWGLIDRDGKYIVNPQFDSISVNRDSPTITVTTSGKSGTIDRDGKFVINPQFDFLSAFDADGRAIVSVGQKYGVVDATGKYVISPQFDNISPDWSARSDNPEQPFRMLSAPLVVQQQGKYGFVDETGKVIIAPQFAFAGPFDASGYAPAAIEEEDTQAFERTRDDNANAVEALIRAQISQLVLGDIHRDGLRMTFSLSNFTMADQVRAWLIQNIRQGRWNVSSDVSRDPQGLITGASIILDQILEATKRNRFGYVDKSGKFIISPQFEEAGNFTASGLAPVRIGTAFGYADTKGKVVINPQWGQAGPFRKVNGDWLAVVGTSGEGSDRVQFGAIDSKGAYKINPQFSSLGSFTREGLAVAQSGELQGAVDATGRYVIQPVYSTLMPIAGTPNFVFVKPIAGSKDIQEIGVVDGAGNVITTVRGGMCGGIYALAS